ncbi:AAA family ATPase [Aerosakkonemataceae cyanobacterium BLCC-F50]|uniref:Uncharacterized AAA domain-containing protein ycf46 n=1 Tax=Floridaenema flaviceps BLCC-F50 TaxID=3153642 RepID=A0ABV4Y1E0_9CYAN
MDWKDLALLLETGKIVSLQSPLIERLATLNWIKQQLATPKNLPVYVWNLGQEEFKEYDPTGNNSHKFDPIKNDCLSRVVDFLIDCQEPGVFVVENLQSLINYFDSQFSDRTLIITAKLTNLFYSLATDNLSRKYIILLSTDGSELPPHLQSVIPTIWKPLPTTEEITLIVEEFLVSTVNWGFNLDKSSLILAASGLTQEEIKTGLRLGLQQSLGASAIDFLLNYKINRLRSLNLDFTPQPHITDFGGLDLLKSAISKIRNKFTPEARKCNLALPKGCLLVGPPGTGKTRAAKACAAQLGFPLVSVDVGAIVAGGLKLLRELLQRVDALAPCVVHFDEFDKLFAASSNSGEDVSNRQILGTMLTWLQEKTSATYVVATLNRLNSLPPELTRAGRFDRIFYLGFPQAIERKEIIQLHAARFDERYLVANEPLDESEWRILLNKTVNCTGAELEQMVCRAADKIFDAALEEIKQKSSPLTTNIEQVVNIPIFIGLQNLLEEREKIFPLYVRDTERVLAIENQSRYVSEPSSSPDTSQYAPPLTTYWGQPVSQVSNIISGAAFDRIA